MNPSYSLRSFAKDLGISVTQVSRVLSGQREMTYRQMTKVLSVLNVSDALAKEMVTGIILKAGKTAKISKLVRGSVTPSKPVVKNILNDVTHYPMERFRMISQWYHFAILELTYVKDFSSDPEWIARTLNVSLLETKAAITRLVNLGFLNRSETGELTKNNSTILFTPKAVEPEIVQYENTMLDKAKRALHQTDEADYQARLINSITFPTSPEAVPEIKAAILEFQKSLFTLIKKHKYTEVYHFGCQLFPVSQAQVTLGKKL